ncbi:MAG: peptidoglycan editing factor PgeF [Deltaproteobacteria bacterium]|nr:peptidoglycan editing factor PgeF [Deltaproteobacteria bacterium]
MTQLPSATSWLQAEGWTSFLGLVHGFSRRLLDREEALTTLGARDLPPHMLKQVHGDCIVTVTQRSPQQERSEADGLISAEAGVLLGIATADCVPVLMVAPSQHLTVAVHAGWRGTLKGISRRAVAMLVETWGVTPSDVYVALGPSIGGCCYEVGPEVGEAIVQRWQIRSASAWRSTGTKGFLDLREVNAVQIAEAGVPLSQIRNIGPCTFCDSTFASYRREGVGAGRQLSVIGWRER